MASGWLPASQARFPLAETSWVCVRLDTGPTHMGSALRIPTVALLGSTCPYRQGPLCDEINARVPGARCCLGMCSCRAFAKTSTVSCPAWMCWPTRITRSGARIELCKADLKTASSTPRSCAIHMPSRPAPMSSWPTAWLLNRPMWLTRSTRGIYSDRMDRSGVIRPVPRHKPFDARGQVGAGSHTRPGLQGAHIGIGGEHIARRHGLKIQLRGHAQGSL